MKIKIEYHDQGTYSVREYPYTLLQFVKIHWGAWGFYRIEKTGTNEFKIYDKFDGILRYTASRAGKNEPLTGEAAA